MKANTFEVFIVVVRKKRLWQIIEDWVEFPLHHYESAYDNSILGSLKVT